MIPSSVTQIGDYAFRDCNNIHKLVIPDSVTSIGNSAFYGCSGIDSLWLGSGLTSIGDAVFHGCSSLKYMYYNARNCTAQLFGSRRSSLFDNTSTPDFTTLVIGDSVKSIPQYAFYNRTRLNKLTISDNVTSVGSYAFYGCSGIDSLWLGSGLTSIGSSAFQDCSGLRFMYYNAKNCATQLFRPDNSSPFCNTNTPYFTTLVIGDSVRSIPHNAFYNRSSLEKLTIPDNVTSIGGSAFYGCSGIDSLWLGSGLTSIGNYAFQRCSDIRTLIIPDSIISIGGYAFAECNNLTNTITGFIHTLGNSVFYNCDNLLSVTTNANTIGRNAFANCDRLVTVTLGDSVQTLGNGAFSGCFRLQNIDLGGVTSIGDSAFTGCVRLERPELPVGLTTIGTRAFDGCNVLAGKLTFPATVTSIGDYAYNVVGTITEIEMQGATPPTIYEHTFNSVSNSTPVSVPCGAVLNYYTTNYWENFSTIVEAPPYKLTVSTNNETMGSAAVSQQPTCNNHSAIIQATAETGFHFLQWSDGNGTNPRTVNMTQDSTFTAVFVPNNSQVTVVPNDPLSGTTSGSGTYGYNAPVTLTATAYDGYHFLKWNDGNTQNPRYMAAVRDTTFTAIFVSNVSTITVGNANPDWGNVSGSGVYYYMNLVSLTATPMYGYHFSRWNDGNTQNPRTITVMQDSSFTAYFAVNTYSIVGTSNSTAMGSVTGGGTYTYLHEMSLTATPAFGYHFVQWNDQNTDNPRTITVTRDSAFTAQFAANSYSITAEPNNPTMGSAYGSGTYNFNTTATLTAVAEYGYHFTQWSDGVTDNPRTVTVQNSATYTAQFEINSYIITVQSSNPAIGTTSGGGSYNYLTPVNITANPNAGYHFTQWSDGNTDNPRLVSVTQNATYTAQFAINSYAVGVQSSNTNMGSVSGSGTYNHNSTATLTATAYYGYHFVQWQDGNTDNPRSVVVTDSAQFTAEFAYNSYLVTANSSNVTIGTATGGGSYNYLSQVALTAVAAPHYHFTMWNDSIEDNPRTITVTRDTVFTAHFAIDRHTIGVLTDDATRGTTSGSDTVDYNTAVWIGATANYGYHFTAWNDGNSSNPRRVVISQDTLFTASFAPNQYTATCMVNDSTMGTAAIATSAMQTGMPVYQGDYLTPLTFTATAHYGYHFTGWSDGVTENPRALTLRQDTSLTAIFAVNTYTVNVAAADSTMGTVGGSGTYNYLSQVNISANASAHHHFLQWNDGNTSNPRMVTLTSDTAFTAIFEEDEQYTIVVNVNDSARGSLTVGSQAGVGSYEADYYIGENVTLIATANEHYYFSQWSDGVTSNPRVVTVIGAATYTAVFEPVSYPVIVTANDYSMGSVSGTGSYPYGSTVTIAAQAFDNYRFISWSDGDTMAVRSITVTGDMQFEARFEARSHEGIEDASGEHITVSVTDRCIVVLGITDDYTIYDLAGRRHAPSEALATGVYLVQVGRWTKKVLVM